MEGGLGQKTFYSLRINKKDEEKNLVHHEGQEAQKSRNPLHAGQKMPEVFADSILIYGRRKIKVKVLLNTGGAWRGAGYPEKSLGKARVKSDR